MKVARGDARGLPGRRHQRSASLGALVAGNGRRRIQRPETAGGYVSPRGPQIHRGLARHGHVCTPPRTVAGSIALRDHLSPRAQPLAPALVGAAGPPEGPGA